MKLKPQPPLPRRTAGAGRSVRGVRGRARPGAGRQARRPGVPLRERLGPRIPSIRRVLAAFGAAAGVAALVALLNGPWLRVTEIAWAGESYTDARDLETVLAAQRGVSVLAVDTTAIGQRLEQIPSIDHASVAVSLTGRVEATVVEREAAFVWVTRTARFIGAADGTLFAGGRTQEALDPSLAALPRVEDRRFVARVVTIGDVIPESLLRVGLRLADVDPAALGSTAPRTAIRLDDEFGFRLVSTEPEWEIAFGVYGLDPRETSSAADARLERQITAVRTLFATRPEAEIGWVDVRNPGKVYFRAKG
jgi:hypothetical protein